MLFASPAAAQWVAADLFPNPPVPTEAGPHGVESLAGVADTAPVERGLGRLRLKLPGGGTVELARDGFERRKDGDVTWRGHVESDVDSRAILTVRNGYMAGRIYYGLEEFEIRPGAGYSHVIERVDTSIVPIDEHVEPEIANSENFAPFIFPDTFPMPIVDSPDNIQLLVAYTPQALAAAGGTPQMEVRIQSMIDLANTAFIDSGMIARYALVNTAEVAYNDSGNVVSDLFWVETSGDVFAKRVFFGADMVSLIVENQGRCAGAAYVMTVPGSGFMPYAYQVTALSCGGGTFTHEHGHNMGFEHNPEDSARSPENQVSDPFDPFPPPPSYPSYPWSFGHYVDGSFRTIMSYPTRCLLDCPTALRFSNPDIAFLGSPTGVVDERDNAQTGDLTAPIVADFIYAVTGAVVNRRVAASVEDVEELADGSVVLNSTTLELGNALSGVQAVGLRFQDLNIPAGMRIDSAYLEFEAADIGSAATSVQIRAEAADSAPAFTGTAFDVTGRPATLASVAWDLPAWGTVTEKHYSPDISAVIQEVVDRPGWLKNNSMALIVGGTGIRAALSHDGGATAAPLLHVEYSQPFGPATVSTPTAAFSYSCTGLTCAFTDQSTDSDGTVVAWSWSFQLDPFAEAVTSIEQNPTITFPAAGTYYIFLRVVDDQGWSGWTGEQLLAITETGANIAPVATGNSYYTKNDVTLSGNVLTDGTPDSDFDGDPLTITGTDSGPYAGTLSMAANGDFTYTPSGSTGTDEFSYTISDGKGGTATAWVTITVYADLVADFRYSCTSLDCAFADASTHAAGDIVSWFWSFEIDPFFTPDTSIERNPSYSFPSAGTYSVNLTVTDSNGVSASVGKQVTVNVGNYPPAAAFSYNCAELSCVFSDGSTDVEGVIAAWSWDFGDGAVSTIQNPTHNYTMDGTYTVALTVTDADGATNTASQAVTVSTPPVAAYTYSCVDLSCGFTDGSTDTDGIASWSWSFGDGATSTAQNPTHIYTADGAYTVALTVTDTAGATNTASQTITVANTAPVAGFTFSCAGLNCGFTDASTDADGVASWSWAFGDGATSTAQNPAHSYAADGTYTATLTVTDTAGATNTASQTVTVANTAPVATDDTYTTDEDIALNGNVLTDGIPDSDVDGDTLTVTANTDPLNGVLTMAVNGAFTYTPAAEFSGADSFAYTMSDGHGASATATVTITVSPVNDLPVVAFDYSCVELTCDFTDRSTDIDSTIVAWTWTEISSDGPFSTAQNPTHVFSTEGGHSIYLQVTDSDGGVRTGDIQRITVGTLVATDNFYTTDEDTAVSGNVLTDGVPDSDANGSLLEVTAHTDPSSGMLTINGTGGFFSYTPNAGFSGVDSFDYTVTSSYGVTDTATVTITVNSVNDAPAATNNAYTIDEDIAVSGNVLTDGVPDSDAEGDPFTVYTNTDPASGTVTVAVNGDFTYTPNADFNGSDSFTYSISDGNLATATATVTITVNPVNDAPVAAFTHSCAGLNCAFTDGSTDPLDAGGGIASWLWSFGDSIVSSLQNPAHRYAADGTYTVTLTVTDNEGATATATEAVTVMNTAPVATDNAYTTAEDVAVGGNVLTDGIPDSDADGDSLYIKTSTSPLNGTLTIAANGDFTYTPNANFNGSDSFDYAVVDGRIGDTATVTITVTPVNDAPVATDNAYTIAEDTAVSSNVLSDGTPDSDADGDAVTVTANTAPLNGTLVIAANGTFTYTSNAEFSGSDGFGYTISDGNGGTATATVSVTVYPVNDAPVATADAYTTNEDTAVSGNVLTDGAPDSDVEGDALTVTANTAPLSGTVSMAVSGAFTYTPNANFNGSDGFDYTISDGNGGAATATVTITVSPVNDAPVATADAYVTDEDVAVSGNVLTDGTPDSDIDGDVLTVTANTAPLNGTVTVAATGAFTYTPNADFNGTDSFTYTVSDGNLGSATATVSVTVNPVNDAPVATDNAYTTNEDVAVSGNVLTDGTPDSDVEGNALTVTANTAPLSGTVTVAANGAFTYTPNADFNGADSFDYTISDGNLGTSTATVSITLNSVNDAPVAGFGFSCTDLDCGFTDGSSDIDGVIAAWSWDFGDGAISAVQNPAHSYAAVDGTYTVTLTVTDNQGASDTIAQSVTVVNPFPPAAPSGLAGTSITSGKGSNAVMAVTLSWTDNAINEEVFVVERCELQRNGGTMTCSFAPIAELGADVTGYAESVPGNASWRYRVKARNRNGESGYSNETEVPNSQT